MPKPFQAVFCEEFSCSEEDFEHTLFWHCLPWHAKVFARMLWSHRESFFKEDFELIREIALVLSPAIFISELNW